MHGEFYHQLYQSEPLVVREAISIYNCPQQNGAILDRRKPFSFGHNLVMQFSVEPACLSKINHRINRPCKVPVNQSDGETAPCDDIPWGDVTMADDPFGTA